MISVPTVHKRHKGPCIQNDRPLHCPYLSIRFLLKERSSGPFTDPARSLARSRQELFCTQVSLDRTDSMASLKSSDLPPLSFAAASSLSNNDSGNLSYSVFTMPPMGIPICLKRITFELRSQARMGHAPEGPSKDRSLICPNPNPRNPTHDTHSSRVQHRPPHPHPSGLGQHLRQWRSICSFSSHDGRR